MGWFWGHRAGPPSSPGSQDSLQLCQCVQILNLLDLVVIEIQLSEAVQLFQVLNTFNQILTEAQSLQDGKGTVTGEATGKPLRRTCLSLSCCSLERG